MKPFRSDGKSSAWLMRLVGGAFFLAGLVLFALLQLGLMNGHPFDPIVAGDASIMIAIGMCASLMGNCLKKIETRLSSLESELSRSRSI
jgi:hypothetical protein